MTEFLSIDLSGVAPKGICADCAEHGLLHLPTDTSLLHCVHNLRGAYRATGRAWVVLAGIERSHFLSMALRGLTLGELKADIARGLAGIIQNQARDAVKH